MSSSITLNTYENGDGNYIAKMNSDNSTLTTAINNLLVSVGSAGSPVSFSALLLGLFGFSASIIGTTSYAATQAGAVLNISTGYAWIPSQTSLVQSFSATALNFAGQAANTYYVAPGSAGSPGFSTNPQDALYEVVWSGSAFTSVSFVGNVFDNAADETALLTSTTLSTTYATILARFEAIETAANVKASSTVFGKVKVDGTTITSAAGVISATASAPPTATTSTLGVVQPDGTTIDVASGVISVPTATTSLLGLVKPDGTTVTISAGVISASGGGGSVLTSSVSSAAPTSFILTNSSLNTIDTTNSGATYNTIAGGQSNTTSGNQYQTICGGRNNSVGSSFGTVVGGESNHANFLAVAGGESCGANGDYSVAFGQNCAANGNLSFAMGYYTVSSGSASMAFGTQSTSYGQNSVALGNYCKAHGSGSVAVGLGSCAGADGSIAVGSASYDRYSPAFVYEGMVYPSDASYPGQCQWEERILGIDAAGTATLTLTCNGGAPGGGNSGGLDPWSAAVFTARFLSINKDTGDVISYTQAESLIARAGGTSFMPATNPVAVLGVTTVGAPTLGMAPTISADSYNGFQIQLANPVGNTNNWRHICQIRMLTSRYDF